MSAHMNQHRLVQIKFIKRVMARQNVSKKRSFVQDVLTSRSPWMGESECAYVNEHFEKHFNAASAASGT